MFSWSILNVKTVLLNLTIVEPGRFVNEKTERTKIERNFQKLEPILFVVCTCEYQLICFLHMEIYSLVVILRKEAEKKRENLLVLPMRQPLALCLQLSIPFCMYLGFEASISLNDMLLSLHWKSFEREEEQPYQNGQLIESEQEPLPLKHILCWQTKVVNYVKVTRQPVEIKGSAMNGPSPTKSFLSRAASRPTMVI